MNYNYYDKYIDKKATGRRDLTPIFHKKEVFKQLIKDMSKPFKKQKIDKIVAIDAMGFILGSAMALELKTGFAPIRKKDMLSGMKKIGKNFVDYTGNEKMLEMNKSAVKKGEKILIVDDWMETGSQLKTAINLIEKQKGKIIGVSLFVAEKREKNRDLFKKYNIKTVATFEGKELEKLKKQINAVVA